MSFSVRPKDRHTCRNKNMKSVTERKKANRYYYKLRCKFIIVHNIAQVGS